MANRIVSSMLGVLSDFCGAVMTVGYAVPATSISEVTNSHVPLGARILDLALDWGLSIGAFYRSFRLLRFTNVRPKPN